jgi:hypothetical protein
VTVGAVDFSHQTVRSPHRTVRWSFLRVPPRSSHLASVPWCTRQSGVWAPDSPVCHRTVRCSTHRQSTGSTLGLFLDLFNVFFWGVAFLNSLVQVNLASYELQTQTLENLLVHGLCWSSNTKTQLAKWPGVHFPYNLPLFGDWWQHNQSKQIIQVFEWKYAIYLLGCMFVPTMWYYGLTSYFGPNNQNHLKSHLQIKILIWWCLVFDTFYIALVPKLLPLWHQPPKRKTLKACRK